jgi:hypothetical protein
MQIFGHRDSGHVSPAVGPSTGRRSEASPATGGSAATGVSPEVEALLGPLALVPDVRAQRVAEVAARLGEGNYVTREAAHRAAAVILDS